MLSGTEKDKLNIKSYLKKNTDQAEDTFCDSINIIWVLQIKKQEQGNISKNSHRYVSCSKEIIRQALPLRHRQTWATVHLLFMLKDYFYISSLDTAVHLFLGRRSSNWPKKTVAVIFLIFFFLRLQSMVDTKDGLIFDNCQIASPCNNQNWCILKQLSQCQDRIGKV